MDSIFSSLWHPTIEYSKVIRKQLSGSTHMSSLRALKLATDHEMDNGILVSVW